MSFYLIQPNSEVLFEDTGFKSTCMKEWKKVTNTEARKHEKKMGKEDDNPWKMYQMGKSVERDCMYIVGARLPVEPSE